MIRPPPRSTRTDTLFPYTTLFRSPTVDVPAETQTQTERQGNKGAQTPLEPPVVVPTVDDRHSPSPAAPPSSAGEPPIEISSSPADIVVTARGEPPAGDPLQEANIAS